MLAQETAYGFIVVYRDAAADRFLLVEQRSGWSFPKGHKEGDEEPIETARRELQEETGITDSTIAPEYVFTEKYIFRRDEIETQKLNTYFLCFVASMENIRPQLGEILSCRFVTFDEALQLFTTVERKKLLEEARDALARIPRA